MSRYRSSSTPVLGVYEEEIEPRRVSRSSALLFGLAVFCAAVTVAFGIWMAGVVPAASMGEAPAAPVHNPITAPANAALSAN